MRFLKYAALLPIVASIGMAQASPQPFLKVPFYDVEVPAASKIYVNYAIPNVHKQTLVCTSQQQDETITSVEWSYKDATRKIELPVTLNDDRRFEGHTADPDGLMIITNDFGSSSESGSIYVSCEYKTMK